MTGGRVLTAPTQVSSVMNHQKAGFCCLLWVTVGHLTVLRKIHSFLLAELLCLVLQEEERVSDAETQNGGVVSTLGGAGLAGAPFRIAVA